LHGDIRYSRVLKDRRGKADGRRIYNIKTERLKLKPIPSTVRLSGKMFSVEYASQSIQCFLCKEFGHIKDDCPNYSPILNNAKSRQLQHVNQETHESASDKPSNQPETNHDKSPTAAQQMISGDKEIATDEDGFIEVKKRRKAKKATTSNPDELIFQFPTIIYPDENKDNNYENLNATQNTDEKGATAGKKWADISPLPSPTLNATYGYASTPTTEPKENDRQQQERLMNLNLFPSSSSKEDKESENEQERNIRQGKLTQKRLHPSLTLSDNVEQ